MRLATSTFEDIPQEILGDVDPLPPHDQAPDWRTGTLDTLYRTHASRLLRFFSRKAGKDDAHDLLHETFARFAGLGSATTTRVLKPEAYLSTVATNLLRDRARVAARRALALHCSFDENNVASSDPHQLLEDRDRLARLEAAVARLNSRRRRIFLLHRLERLTYAEIAVEVGMSVKGVKKQMAKALFELRRDIGPL
jgi:RNA polymerase sigma-70 factor (ECF subfamily)